MYNLSTPTNPPLQDYDLVVSRRTRKSRERLLTIRSEVGVAYDSYRNQATPLAAPHGANFTARDRGLLAGNFRKLDKNASCSQIRFDILASTRQGRCPYCRLEEATTLDHILEKKTHPEFSILRENLAPACARCNTVKETNSHLVANRETLHLYYDGFPTQGYLISTPLIHERRVSFEFTLKAPPGIDPTWWDAVDAHFTRLELGPRYRSRAQVEMQDRREELHRVRIARGSTGVEKFLRSNAQSVAHNWSPQDWLPVLLSGAAASTEFCDWGVYKL